MSSSAGPMTLGGSSNGLLKLPTRFMRWWLGELAGLLPGRLRGASANARSSLVLELGDQVAVLIERSAGGGKQELGRLDGETIDDTDGSALGTSGLASLNDRRYRSWPLVVRLKSSLGLRKVVELPKVADEELGQLLQFELDRLTPFKADDVSFAWRVVETDGQAGQSRVELEMAPKAIIERAVGIADRFGREIERIELESDDDDRRPLNLLPKTLDSDGTNWFLRALQIVTIVLVIAAIAIPLVKQRSMLREVEAETSTFREQAEDSLALREELDTLKSDAGFLFAAKSNQTSMIETIGELTRLLPDDSYLIQLTFEGARLELAGFAAKASDLIAILDRSPMLSSPEFQSPVVFDRKIGKERFLISVDLVERTS